MDKLYVDLGQRSYNIHFSDSFAGLAGCLEEIGAPKKLLVVTDTNVLPLYGEDVAELLNSAGYDASICAVTAGEEHKNMDAILGICGACIKHGLDRHSMIIALGGGVVGDMAGFAASIYMRGIDFIQIPTTLLAQSDSSVGGKTGIDFMDSKNILGAFHQPRLVYINVGTLKTLPDKQLVSGMGEVIKHGIIRDAEFYKFIKGNLEQIMSFDAQTLIKMAKQNCAIKAQVVMRDERESGLREILNFGHTIGHAVESALDFSLTHGECVGLGMAAAAHISVRRGLLKETDAADIESVLDLYGFRLKMSLPPTDVIYGYMQRDKKKANGRLKFVLPVRIGEVITVSDITENEIHDAIGYISL